MTGECDEFHQYSAKEKPHAILNIRTARPHGIGGEETTLGTMTASFSPVTPLHKRHPVGNTAPA